MHRLRPRGFTLIEAVVVIAIIGVLAALAYGIMRAAQRNASLGGAAYELVQHLRELRFKAMTENQDYTFVFANSATADALDCDLFHNSSCARWWVLRTPPNWEIANFSPTAPVGGGAEYVDSGSLPRGVHLSNTVPFTAPAPFAGALLGDTELTKSISSRDCFAIRFEADGKVSPVSATGPPTPKKVGYAFGLASSFTNESAALEGRVVLVAFPNGIVKVFTR